MTNHPKTFALNNIYFTHDFVSWQLELESVGGLGGLTGAFVFSEGLTKQRCF